MSGKRIFTIVLSAAVLLSAGACKKKKKDEPKPTEPTTGTITVRNKKVEGYKVWVNQTYQGVVAANDSVKFTVVYGSYKVDVVQNTVISEHFDFSDFVTASHNADFTIE